MRQLRLVLRFRLQSLEEQVFITALFGLDGDPDQILALEIAAQNLFGERILNMLLDRSAKGPGAEVVAGSFVDQELLGFERTVSSLRP